MTKFMYLRVTHKSKYKKFNNIVTKLPKNNIEMKL